MRGMTGSRETYNLEVFPEFGGGEANWSCWLFSDSIGDVLCKFNFGAAISCCAKETIS